MKPLIILSIILFSLTFVSAFNFEGTGGYSYKNVTTYNNNTYYNLTGGGINASSITCGGTNKFSAYDNATGIFTCSVDDTTASGLSSAEVNNTINTYLGNSNSSYLSTYNSTYAPWAFNQTANLVLSGTMGVNSTQMENATIINIKESWLTSLITSLFDGTLFRNFFNQDLNTTASPVFSRVNVTSGYLCNSSDCFSLNDLNATTSSDLSSYYTKAEVDSNLSLYLLLTDQRFNETTLALAINNTAKDKFNITYDAYALNVSLNYTKIVYDTYNSLWTGGNSTFNQSLTDLLYSGIVWGYNQTTDAVNYLNATYGNWWFNQTANLVLTGTSSAEVNNTINTYLGNSNASYLSTYNSTYAGYLNNVSRNWTLDTYNNWNLTWSSTYNETYDAFTLNVSLNYTKIVYDAYNSVWGGSSGMANYSNFSNSTSNWNTLNGAYNNTNSTQMTNTDGTLSVSPNWLATFLVSIWVNYFDQQLNISSSPTFTNLNVTTNITNQGTIYAGNITYYENGCYRKVNATGLYDIC